MKVLILGATGRTGHYFVEEALKEGYRINLLVRDRSKILTTSILAEVFDGTPTNKEELANAMEGCDCILSSLNISRTTDFPWSKLRTPKNFLSESMKNIIELANNLAIKHVIITTAWGVNETRADIPFWFRWLIEHSNIAFPYNDHGLQEELLRNSSLNWTIIRPVGLTNSLKVKDIIESTGNIPRPSLTIGRQNVARFMVGILQKESYFRKSLTISEK